jgi:processive 1,2-diacylglycerol beta-glucosyltransferase
MSVSAGAGHIKAANALEKTFFEDPRVSQVIHQDALVYTNKLFRDFYSKFYQSLVRSAPNFLGWWYKSSDEPWRTDSMRHMIDRLNTRPLVRFVREFDPHITVCTHFMPAGIISHLIAAGRLDARLSIVVTDFNFHAMWLSRAFQRYFVAMNETKASLESLGLPSDRVTVSGIPIDPVFSVPIDRLNECRRLALEPTRPIVLLSAGAAGSGPAEFMVQQLMMLDDRIQVVIVCGHNLDLRNRIDAIVQANPRFRVLGYTDAMSTLMQLADLLIGKPGGMTSAEALAAGLPMCIVNPIPGQEERNSDHLLEEGVAIKCNDLGALAYKVGQLLDRPDRLANMRANASRLARPFAARTVVNTLLDESHNIPPLALTRHQRLKMSIARRS